MSLDILLQLLVITFVFLASVAGQSTDVTCQAQWALLDNSRQQNPCLVAAYLLSPCESSGPSIPPLSTGIQYTLSANVTTTTCICSTVTYSMLAACALCQSGKSSSWSEYSSTCSIATYNQQYLPPIPGDTAVPEWAYFPVEIFDGLDVQAITNAITSSSMTDSTATTTSSMMYGASTTAPTTTTPVSASSASSYDTPSSPTNTNSLSPPNATSVTSGSASFSKKFSVNSTVILIVGIIGAIIPVLGIVSWLYLTRRRGPQNKIKDIEIFESEIMTHARASVTVDPFSLRVPPYASKAVGAEAVPPLPIRKDTVYSPPRYSVCVRGP